MRHLSNIYDPRRPDAIAYLPLTYEESIEVGGRERAWKRHLDWIAANVVDRPKATDYYTVEELESMHMVGIYAHD